MNLAYQGFNGTLSYEHVTAFKTLTLCAAEGGTLTADTITGFPGDTIELAPTYDTYWRFSGYNLQGDGSIADNTYTFGSDDEQIVSAYFKKNAFTATGGWEKGSNVTCTARYGYKEGDATIGTKYAVHGSHTGDIPASWYSTSNRWKVNSTVSAYNILLMPKMTVNGNGNNAGSKYWLTACTLIGSTSTQSQSFERAGNGNLNYSKSFNSTTTGVNYGISGHMHTWAKASTCTATYVANSTTGTWSATGYAP